MKWYLTRKWHRLSQGCSIPLDLLPPSLPPSLPLSEKGSSEVRSLPSKQRSSCLNDITRKRHMSRRVQVSQGRWWQGFTEHNICRAMTVHYLIGIFKWHLLLKTIHWRKSRVGWFEITSSTRLYEETIIWQEMLLMNINSQAPALAYMWDLQSRCQRQCTTISVVKYWHSTGPWT